LTKAYLIQSKGYGNYSRGFISVEVVNQDTLDKLKQLVEADFSFYEYETEGKHSESHVHLDDTDFVVISEDVNDIISFKRLFGDHLGNHNFSDYVLEKAYENGFFDNDEEGEDDNG
jgi:hypothetical protein